jgi:hypothetical protein
MRLPNYRIIGGPAHGMTRKVNALISVTRRIAIGIAPEGDTGAEVQQYMYRLVDVGGTALWIPFAVPEHRATSYVIECAIFGHENVDPEDFQPSPAILRN